VIGIELVEDAVKQFFAAHATEPERTTDGPLVIHRAGAITVIAGDIFAVTPTHVGSIDGIFDRAALVALPPEMRVRYVAQLRALAPAIRRELLVSIEYPEGAHPGPPFCVESAEIRSHYPDAVIHEIGYGPDPQGRLDGQMRERCFTLEWPR
jgi:thiopurine S-methyltransferase